MSIIFQCVKILQVIKKILTAPVLFQRRMAVAVVLVARAGLLVRAGAKVERSVPVSTGGAAKAGGVLGRGERDQAPPVRRRCCCLQRLLRELFRTVGYV